MVSPGQGEAHKFVKGPSGWAKACVTNIVVPGSSLAQAANDEEGVYEEPDGGCFDAFGSPQDHVKARERFWHPVRGIDGDAAAAPSLPPISPDDVRAIAKPDPAAIRKVAAKFKTRASF